MSYDPRPPRQERWPSATPREPWRPYPEDGAYQADGQQGASGQDSYWATAGVGYRDQAGYQQASGGPAPDRGYPSQQPRQVDPFASYPGSRGRATGGFAAVGDGYRAEAGERNAWDGYGAEAGQRNAWDGYPEAGNGYGDTANGFYDAGDGFDGAQGGYGDAQGGYSGAQGGYSGAQDGYSGSQGGYSGAQGGYGDLRDGYLDTGDGYRSDGNGYDRSGNGYAAASGTFAGTADGYGTARDGYAAVSDRYAGAANGYGGTADGYGGAYDGYAPAPGEFGGTPDGYGPAPAEFGGTADGYGGGRYDFGEAVDFAGAGEFAGADEFAGAGGYAGVGVYREPRSSGAVLAAPDAGMRPETWQAAQMQRWEARRRGLMVGVATGFLAAAVAVGVSTLAAAFVGRQASPVVSVGDVLINRISPALTHTAGGHDKSILMLGIGVAIVAIVIGLLARRAASLGVAGLAALALVGAFVAVTRPDSHVTDVFPSVFGGLAGVLALVWLVHASAPVTPNWPTRGSGRRRAR
jgi:hypothetical protein